MKRFYSTREFKIPSGATKVSDKLSDAVAYLYTIGSPTSPNGSAPCAMVFYGQQSKPVQRYRHRNEAEREEFVRRAFTARQQHAARKVERHAERQTATATVKLEIGKTYHDRSSCDYDTIYSFIGRGRSPIAGSAER